MNKKKLKKLIAVAILLVVLGGLIVGAVLMKKSNEDPEEEAPAEDTATVVFDKGSSIVTNISFENKENSMSFSYVNEDWVYDADNNFPLDQDSVAAMASAVGTVSATVTLENVSDDLGDYGLKAPSLIVKAKFSDGSEKLFSFGDTNSFNSCRYLMISGDENVYMIEEDVADPFSADLDYLYEPEIYTLQKSSVTDEDITSIKLVTAGGQEKEITDSKGIYDLYELVYTLDLSEYEDYYADENEMKHEYGISPEGERVIISYTEEDDNGTKVPKEYTVFIGFKYEDAEASDEGDEAETTDADDEPEYSYFYSHKNSTVVYTADGETVDDIFGFLAYEPKVEETTA